MGREYVETIGMYDKKEYKEWSSEERCYYPIDMVFNKQYGIFYYEPADETEAIMMIDRFKEKIRELEAKYIGED